MAWLHNLLLSVTVVTMLTSVYATKYPFQQERPSSNKDGISFLDIEQLQIIKTESTIDKPVEVNEDLNRPVVPESCKNTTYCEEVINYPEEDVSNLIATLGKYVILQEDKLDKPDTPNVKLCKSNDTVIHPRYGAGYDGRSHLLVNGNSKKEKLQGFGIQTCTETDCQCDNKVLLAYEKGYRGRCKQFYIYRPATAFERNGSYLYQTHIKLPFYCACIVELCLDNCDDNQKYEINMPATKKF